VQLRQHPGGGGRVRASHHQVGAGQAGVVRAEGNRLPQRGKGIREHVPVEFDDRWPISDRIQVAGSFPGQFVQDGIQPVAPIATGGNLLGGKCREWGRRATQRSTQGIPGVLARKESGQESQGEHGLGDLADPVDDGRAEADALAERTGPVLVEQLPISVVPPTVTGGVTAGSLAGLPCCGQVLRAVRPPSLGVPVPAVGEFDDRGRGVLDGEPGQRV